MEDLILSAHLELLDNFTSHTFCRTNGRPCISVSNLALRSGGVQKASPSTWTFDLLFTTPSQTLCVQPWINTESSAFHDISAYLHLILLAPINTEAMRYEDGRGGHYGQPGKAEHTDDQRVRRYRTYGWCTCEQQRAQDADI